MRPTDPMVPRHRRLHGGPKVALSPLPPPPSAGGSTGRCRPSLAAPLDQRPRCGPGWAWRRRNSQGGIRVPKENCVVSCYVLVTVLCPCLLFVRSSSVFYLQFSVSTSKESLRFAPFYIHFDSDFLWWIGSLKLTSLWSPLGGGDDHVGRFAMVATRGGRAWLSHNRLGRSWVTPPCYQSPLCLLRPYPTPSSRGPLFSG